MSNTMAIKSKFGWWRKVVMLGEKYPVCRGMVSYATIWPIGSMVQQQVEGREEYDYGRIVRFLLFGSCYVAPTLNLWLKIAKHMWPQNNLSSALAKAAFEQISYTPFAMVSFYFGMTLLEGKSIKEANHEVADKFLPTYQVGVCVWPIIQTVNYTFISEKNRVPFVSLCSLVWSSFLAYMKHLEGAHFKQPITLPLKHH